MSSFYDDASLVVIPSGYKTSKVYAEKPTDGSGDLAFTRTGDTATRVNSAGLIERVRTNVALYSEDFTWGGWNKYQAAITANSVLAPNGTTTADTITDNTVNDVHIAYQSISFPAGEYSVSCYAKANTLSHAFLQIYNGTSFYVSGIFNLTNGTVSGAGSITSVGNGWYRISFTAQITAGVGFAYVGTSNGSSVAYVGTGQSIYIWGYQAETGVATDYIPTTTAAVSVGPVANVPRLDYLGSTCPRLLLEPQSLNKCPNSSSYGTNLIQTTVTRNVATAPTGYTEADLLQDNNALDEHLLGQNFDSITNGLPYTVSCFFKANGSGGRAVIRYYGGTWVYAVYNLANGTVAATDGSITTTIENYGNGWYRCSLTHTAVSDYTPMVTQIGIANSSNQFSYQGTSSLGIYFWGFQAEQKSYPTSLIPTVGASATRGADACSKTGISSLIGQTQGTLYAEIDWVNNNVDRVFSTLSDGTTNNRIHFGYAQSGNVWYLYVEAGGVQQANITLAAPINGRYKIAVGYKLNDYAFYVNGSLIASDTSATVPTTSQLNLGGFITAGLEQSINQTILFQTRLTNSELASLTSL